MRIDDPPTSTPLPDVLVPNLRPPAGWCPPALGDDAELALVTWELLGRRGLVAHPGPSTRVALGMAATARSGVATLVLTPSAGAAAAWRRAFATTYAGEVGSATDGPARLAPLTVATREGARLHRGALARRFGLIVIDGPDPLERGPTAELLEHATAPWRLELVGAAPRTPAAVARLRRLVGPVAYELTVAELPEVSPRSFDVVVLGVTLDPAERAAYDVDAAVLRDALGGFFGSSPFGSWQDFLRLAQRTPGGRRAVAALARMRGLLAVCKSKTEVVTLLLRRHRGQRVLVLTPDNASAHGIARRELVMPITSDLSARERDAALQAFRAGTLRTLVSAQGLHGRPEVPEADVLIVAGGSRGEREHLLRLGRLLRPNAGTRGTVYEIVTQHTLEVGQARRRRRGLETHARAQL